MDLHINRKPQPGSCVLRQQNMKVAWEATKRKESYDRMRLQYQF